MWKLAHALSIGSSHLKTGSPCQDYLACKLNGQGVIALVVADGAGSASFGGDGAKAAVEAVIEHIENTDASFPFERIISEAVGRARERVLALAEQAGCDKSDFATTLICAIASEQEFCAAQIGDGVLCVRSESGAWQCVFWPQHGEYINSTCFLTDDNALNLLSISNRQESVCDIVMMSDGLEKLALDYGNKAPFSPFLDNIIRPLETVKEQGENEELSGLLKAFIDSDRVKSRTDDDISIILASRRY